MATEMTRLRAIVKHRWTLALWLAAAALFVRAIVPVGYMVDGNGTTLSFTICNDGTGATATHDIVIPDDDNADLANADSPCAFAGLGYAALGGADGPVLAAAILFILALGFAPVALPRIDRARHIRPPLRGPPAIL